MRVEVSEIIIHIFFSYLPEHTQPLSLEKALITEPSQSSSTTVALASLSSISASHLRLPFGFEQ